MLPDFSTLTPDCVAEAAEAVLGRPVSGSFVPYPSYINRVYGLEDGEGERFILKCYRPGRWEEDALREEHAFMAACHRQGLPVVAPLPDADGETLSAMVIEDGGEHTFFYALYPFIHSPGWEPVSTEDWLYLGRLIARLHQAGAEAEAVHRPRISVHDSGRPSVERLLGSGLVHPDLRGEFADLCGSTLEKLSPLFEGVRNRVLHGDLHRGNILRGTPEPRLIDFDDMAVGPAVQDLWLLLPGRLSEARSELNLLLEGYEELFPFDRSEIELIEPLRFLRMLAFLDWQSRQRLDAGFSRAFGEDWGSRSFWIKEVEDLRDQAGVALGP